MHEEYKIRWERHVLKHDAHIQTIYARTHVCSYVISAFLIVIMKVYLIISVRFDQKSRLVI